MLLTEYDEKKHMKLLREEGEERFGMLTAQLLEQERIDDAIKAAKDKEYRKKLFDEFGL